MNRNHKWSKWSINHHRPLRSDNINDTMRLNRILSKPYVIAAYVMIWDLIIFFLFNFVVNMISMFPPIISGGLSGEEVHIEFWKSFAPHRFADPAFTKNVYIFLFIALVIFSGIKLYKVRIAYSEKDINKGNEGKQRWTTLKEIDQQYKSVPLYPSSIDEKTGEIKTNYYKGKSGVIISRWRDRLYIDTQLTNNLYLGTTRSGKGEMYVFPTIDICSRAENIEDRPSMIIFDPKLELYKGSKERLENRSYEVRLINLDNPLKSAGYDPLFIAVQHYKNGFEEKAQQAAKTYAFGIFNSNDDKMQESIWKNTATDLFTALIIANISDCLDADEELNMKRRKILRIKKEQYLELNDPDIKKRARSIWENAIKEKSEDYDPVTDMRINCIPEDYTFHEIHPNEKKINCFSVINFFKDLCDRASIATGKDMKAAAKKTDSLLDDYFNNRPDFDFARNLYATIKVAGDRTKGSIYVNMQSALSVFLLNNIAKMTAKNDIDFESLGYGEKPMAVFLGLPSEDRSNWFLATTFVAQVCQYLYSLAKMRGGKLQRHLRFILDEFGNMPTIENFANYVTVSLGMQMSFDIFIQSYNQIESKYEDDSKTILDNFANQIYILNGGKESSEDFSELLGPRTKIKLQRSGERLSTEKSYTENEEDVPLMFPEELRSLKEGESVLCRVSKRRDRFGGSIKPLPIINEYAKLSFINKATEVVRTLKERIVKGKEVIADEGIEMTFSQELKKRLSEKAHWSGTALLYRWQYMQRDFPDPYKVSFNKICSESCENIDYLQRVNNPAKVAAKLSENSEKISDKAFKNTLKSLRTYPKFYNMMSSRFGEDFMDDMNISETDPIKDIKKKIEYINADEDFKNKIRNILRQ
ncbi:MAG: type IV secretory system conjugative DNA transfer family protein [Firmicutes bacterium]|nr:type IV secretory system conjugative DNA transfer family protein [Bacillota bacterium]